jgi:hypothetical protein
MSMGGGGKKEPKSAKLLRARQIADLADLDEEENRRIKALMNARTSGRAFRAPGSARTASNTRGSLASASGFNVPAISATRSAGSVGGGGRGTRLAP